MASTTPRVSLANPAFDRDHDYDRRHGGGDGVHGRTLDRWSRPCVSPASSTVRTAARAAGSEKIVSSWNVRAMEVVAQNGNDPFGSSVCPTRQAVFMTLSWRWVLGSGFAVFAGMTDVGVEWRLMGRLPPHPNPLPRGERGLDGRGSGLRPIVHPMWLGLLTCRSASGRRLIRIPRGSSRSWTIDRLGRSGRTPAR